MATTTTNFSLRKPDGTAGAGDTINVATDINGSMDTIDAEMGSGDYWSAQDSGYLAWTADPGAFINNTLSFTSHTYFLSALRCHKAGTVANISVINTTLGTRTDLRFGIYGPTGTKLGTTGNITSSLTATGYNKFALSASFAITPGIYYVVGWEIDSVASLYSATTVPAGGGSAANGLGVTTSRRSGSVSDGGSGTDVPASLTVSSGVVTSPAFVSAASTAQFWAGLSV